LKFNSQGYDLKFIQKDRCRQSDEHLFVYIFKFNSPVTKLNYIVRAEYYDEDYCAVKFYIQQQSKSEKKYNILINNTPSDIANILITTSKCMLYVLKLHPLCSFGFIASPTYEIKFGKRVLVENVNNNQRFKVYKHAISRLFDGRKFTEYYNTFISSILLVNNKNEGLDEKRRLIEADFSRRWRVYPLPDML
jgi:hypothetical protein